jgi:hypothetical protein
VLVEALAVGVCGTDVEIVEGKYGWAPSGQTRLVLGHESLGRVVDPGPTGGLKKGDLDAGIVRRPDPVPCPNCAVGEWDLCRNGQSTERGIKQIHGFMSGRWRIEPEYVGKVDPSLGLLRVLLEPATVVAKAWEQVAAWAARSGSRGQPGTGAGPISLPRSRTARGSSRVRRSTRPGKSGPKPKRCVISARLQQSSGRRFARRHRRMHRRSRVIAGFAPEDPARAASLSLTASAPGDAGGRPRPTWLAMVSAT